jgi:hypothetical protein
VRQTTAQLRIATKPSGGAWNTKETFPISADKIHDITYPGRTGISVGPLTQVKIEVFDVGANDAVIDAGFDIEGEDA